jgi:hypothetical protein
MANLYTAVLKRHEDGNIRDQQRRWLSTFQACTDAPCVKDYYDDRINALMDTKGGRELSTHFFTKGSNGNEGRLSVFGPQHGWLAVSIFSIYVGDADAGDVNSDGIYGVIALKNRSAQLSADACVVELHRLDDRRWQVTQTVQQAQTCVLARGVTFVGVYRR